MIGNCIICGVPVIVSGSPEFATCNHDDCIGKMESCIGQEYQAGHECAVETKPLVDDHQAIKQHLSLRIIRQHYISI